MIYHPIGSNICSDWFSAAMDRTTKAETKKNNEKRSDDKGGSNTDAAVPNTEVASAPSLVHCTTCESIDTQEFSSDRAVRVKLLLLSPTIEHSHLSFILS